MSEADLTDIGACVFDAYGTLFDVHSAVGALRPRLEPKADAVSATWRDKQVQYTWLRSLMGRHADFWAVTGDALDFALEQNGVDDPPLRDALMQAYLELTPYAEVAATLAALRERGLKLAILSNGTPAMLDSAVTNASLNEAFDAVLSVESVGIYKPDPRVYQLAVDQLGVARERIAFMSSNAWDAAGAASFGFRVVWVNRFGQPKERLPDGPAAELTDLAGLPALLGA
ncbi:MAG: haloacid dehalogenase type II [Gammaproteobacteria bacterium]